LRKDLCLFRLFEHDFGVKADYLLSHSPLDDLLKSVEGASAYEQDIRGVKLQKFLMRMLTPTLRRNICNRAFENFQQCLLYSLTADIARNRRIVRTS